MFLRSSQLLILKHHRYILNEIIYSVLILKAALGQYECKQDMNW